MIIDTIMYAGLIILLLIAGAIGTWDYIESKRPNGRTISRRALEFYLRHKNKPIIWIAISGVICLNVGLILGLILGHLYWPQIITE